MKSKLLVAVAVVLALLIGTGTGIAVATRDPKKSDEYRELASTLAVARASLASAKATIVQDQKTIGDLPVLRAQAKSQLAKIASDGAKLRRQLVSERAALAARQRVVNAAYNRIEQNRVSDGVYVVGTDMAPGTYRTTGASSDNCYWQISSDPNGTNIIANGNTTSSAFAQVSRGEYFKSDGCEEWVIQR